MEDSFVNCIPNPKLEASCLSKLLFGWIIKLCFKTESKNFSLYQCLPSHNSKELCTKLEVNWKKELMFAKSNNTRPVFYKAIIKTFRWSFIINGISQFFVFCVLKTTQPILLFHFISLFSENSNYEKLGGKFYEKIIYGASIPLLSILMALLFQHEIMNLSSIGLKVNIACSSLIYKKMLHLNEKSLTITSVGRILNILSKDVQIFNVACSFINYFWIIPIQLIIITYFTWLQVQFAGIIGILSILLLTIPIHAISTKLLKRIKQKVSKETDMRINKICEIISNIRLIKMCAWEKQFLVMINDSRIRELDIKSLVFYSKVFSISFMMFMDKFALCATLITFSLTGNVVTTPIIYCLTQFFNILRLSMGTFYPLTMSYLSDCLVSLERIEQFLLLEEILDDKIQKTKDKRIIFEDVEASWISEKIILTNINLNIPKGSLCILAGPVGSGKTSLLQLVINTLTPSKGNVKVGGNVSYSVQNSWVFDSTIRNNILFGEKYDKKLYDTVIQVCELEQDFRILSNGDRTIVGENGIQLSGGQKARISLARAVYKNSDIYLLDDPLAALDVQVADKLFNNCIVNFLRNKTRVLVTNQLQQFSKKADYIIYIENGRVLFEDYHQYISNSRLPLLSLQENKENFKIEKNTKIDTIQIIKKDNKRNAFNIFWKFALFGGNYVVHFGLLLFFIISQVSATSVDVLTFYWSYKESINKSKYTEEKSDDAITVKFLSTDAIMTIYAALVIFLIIVSTSRTIYFQQVIFKVIRNIHKTMLKSVLSTYLQFFDKSSIGEIVHRFTNDIWIIDDIIPPTLLLSAQMLFVTLGNIGSVAILNYYMIIPIIILSVIFYKALTWQTYIANKFKHEESTSKSSLLAHISASFTGLSTIRAMEKENILIKEFHQYQDKNTSMQYLSVSFRCAMCMFIQLLTAILQGSLIISLIIASQFAQDILTESIVGFSISQTLILTGSLQYGAIQIVSLCGTLKAIENILEYTKLESEEKQNEANGVYSSLSWPKKGKINFQNVSMKYSKTGLSVLKNISFNIASREKIGVVGRTGAGKSSLIYALLRLAPVEGNIIIDGVNTKDIQLSQLRKNISIIPQDPILFAGTLRYNLDPFNNYSDNELWEVLEKVELKSIVDSLNYKVKKGGTGFSVGQKQLICLARAILRKNKILVLDEATANVDLRTDKLIQNTIRSTLSDCTVITIAHRLCTVIDADRVIVMDFGTIVENDSPYMLLQNSDGIFYRMVEQTGTLLSLKLRNIADRNKYKNKY